MTFKSSLFVQEVLRGACEVRPFGATITVALK